MSIFHFQLIAKELSITIRQVESTVELLDGGGTVPFISRYRKEVTGELDEVQITAIRDRIEQLRELDKRREAVLKSISEQGKLTPELQTAIDDAKTMSELEDIYLPYKPKRRTKATIAREKGLEPLALFLMEQNKEDLMKVAKLYVSLEKMVASPEEALAGARDIVAEMINEDKDARAKIRKLFMDTAIVSSRVMTGKEIEAQKFKDYFDWKEPIKNIPSHRLLALRRGEKEGFLLLDIQPETETAFEILSAQFVLNRTEAAEHVKVAMEDAYKRLMAPSIETDVRMGTKDVADDEAIKVFAENLKQLLLTSPMGQKNVLSIDPGFRTGCKVVVLDRQGKLLHNDVIYPEMGEAKKLLAEQTILANCAKYDIEAIAIGNGTAGRETEEFVRKLGLPESITIVMVNESGASVYSASPLAREEFPDYDVTVRGAVSIGRRLMDPLAELVKIDPKAIGVGQYQHDVDQNKLKTSLDDVVISAVNAVGVEVNTASKQLLTYVSGLGPQLAENIVKFRDENGPFKTRDSLRKVARMGDKAYEQCAGFLRIRDAIDPLDGSSVHPEAYQIVEIMAKDQNCSVSDLMKKEELRKGIDIKKYVTEKFGLPTLQDIVKELSKPGRDPREKFETFSFTTGINKMQDLRVGMKLPGIVTNVTNFGAFVDIGVHQDGLVHVSQLSDTFVSDPKTAVKVAQKVVVTVTELDIDRKRIALTMKDQTKGGMTTTGEKSRSGAGGARKETKKEPEIQGSLQDQLMALRNKFKS
ncbi:MAG: RNA-binding transcriptional accessory protein [Cytophagales bacterium]|nr:MAG: RNA-binding transcriptional accessory protein [Cytophagales bacterium]